MSPADSRVFIERPQSVLAPFNSTAIFSCRADSRLVESLEWQVNGAGTSNDFVAEHLNKIGIYWNSSSSGDSLQLSAHASHNNSGIAIECLAYFHRGTDIGMEKSGPAHLTVYGRFIGGLLRHQLNLWVDIYNNLLHGNDMHTVILVSLSGTDECAQRSCSVPAHHQHSCIVCASNSCCSQHSMYYPIALYTLLSQSIPPPSSTDRPSTPSDVSLSSLAPLQLKLTWSAPFSLPGVNLSYTVTITTLDPENGTTIGAPRYETVQDTSVFIFKPIEPDDPSCNQFMFSVAAENGAGASADSRAVSEALPMSKSHPLPSWHGHSTAHALHVPPTNSLPTSHSFITACITACKHSPLSTECTL